MSQQSQDSGPRTIIENIDKLNEEQKDDECVDTLHY